MLRTLFPPLLLLLHLTPALAASGQYEGIYVREGRISLLAGSDELELKCVLAPVVIGADGVGAGYFLVTEKFKARGVMSYIKGQEFNCNYNAATKLETCRSKEFSDGKVLNYYRSNVYQTFTPDLQLGHTLLTPEEVVNWNSSGKVNPDNRFAYHRCDCLSAEKLAPHFSTEANELSGFETGVRLFWGDNNPSDDDYGTARDVIEKLGGCNIGEVS